MENIPTIHFHISHMISLWTSIHRKHGDIGKKNSNNKKASYDSHIHFLPSKARWFSAEPLNLWAAKVLALEDQRDAPFSVASVKTNYFISQIDLSFEPLVMVKPAA